MKILIIIPAYNEADNIERVINNLTNNFPEYDYIIVNDGSTDETSKICKANGFNLLNLPLNLGLAGAFQTGVKLAYEKDYEVIVQLDGDGQHDPKFIDKMLKMMNNTDSDIIIGSRFKEEKMSLGIRMIGSAIIKKAIKITTGCSITDPTSGMRLFNRKMMREFAYNINFGPEPDTISYLIRCGYKINEIQVKMNERVAGNSYFNLKRAMQYMINMVVSIVFIQWFREKVDEKCQIL